MKGWLLLSFAIGFEIFGTVNMKLSEGLTKIVPSILIFVLYGVSFALFALALKYIEVSVAYAIWSGVGTATISVIGFFVFDESMNVVKVGAIFLIVVGVIGLNLRG